MNSSLALLLSYFIQWKVDKVDNFSFKRKGNIHIHNDQWMKERKYDKMKETKTNKRACLQSWQHASSSSFVWERKGEPVKPIREDDL